MLENFISVSFLGSVFYQPYKVSLDMKIHGLKLKEEKIDKYLAIFLCHSIKRMASIFSYGNQLSSKDLTRQKILLPINSTGNPDWQFMSNYMQTIENELISQWKAYAVQLAKESSVADFIDVKWKAFRIANIFSGIQRGKRLKIDDHILGKMPYVSSTALDNGIDSFIGNTIGVRKLKDCLTLANSGSVGSCFYQPFECIASDHVTQLKNANLNKYQYEFISSILSRLSEKYSFNREINDERLKAEKILLPIDSTGNPDYQFMERCMKSIEAEQVNHFAAFLTKKGM